MIINKDWIKSAAEEIATHFLFGPGRDSYVTDEQRHSVAAHYAEIIGRHCPFKPDVAYIEAQPNKPHEFVRRGPVMICKHCRERADGQFPLTCARNWPLEDEATRPLDAAAT